MQIIGLIIVLAALAFGAGGSLPLFLDPPSAIMTVVGALGILWFGGGSVLGMLKALGGGGSEEERRAAARTWGLAGTYALGAGAVATLIGVVIIMTNTDDVAAVGPGLAIGLLTTLYGLVLALGICWPAKEGIEEGGSREQ